MHRISQEKLQQQNIPQSSAQSLAIRKKRSTDDRVVRSSFKQRLTALPTNFESQSTMESAVKLIEEKDCSKSMSMKSLKIPQNDINNQNSAKINKQRKTRILNIDREDDATDNIKAKKPKQKPVKSVKKLGKTATANSCSINKNKNKGGIITKSGFDILSNNNCLGEWEKDVEIIAKNVKYVCEDDGKSHNNKEFKTQQLNKEELKLKHKLQIFTTNYHMNKELDQKPQKQDGKMKTSKLNRQSQTQQQHMSLTEGEVTTDNKPLEMGVAQIGSQNNNNPEDAHKIQDSKILTELSASDGPNPSLKSFKPNPLLLTYQWSTNTLQNRFMNSLSIAQDLPDENPMQQVIREYAQKRQDYMKNQESINSRSQSQSGGGLCGTSSKRSNSEDLNQENQSKPQSKPKLEEFLNCFEEKVKSVNNTYQQLKQQFEKDMKSFKASDIQKEEDLIQKSMKDDGYLSALNYTPELWQNQIIQQQLLRQHIIDKTSNDLNDELSSAPDFNKQGGDKKPLLDIDNHNDFAAVTAAALRLNAQAKSQIIQGSLRQLQQQQQQDNTSNLTFITQSQHDSSQMGGENSLALKKQVQSTMPGESPALPDIPLLGTSLSIKQQRSQTVLNYIQYISDFYEDFQVQPNCLQSFYPKQVQRNLMKRKNQPTDRIVQGLKAPQKLANGSINYKALNKMKLLTKCQANFMQVVLQKIDRRSKPIRKQEKIVNKSLRNKNIYLEEENFDILTLLKKDHMQCQADLKNAGETSKQENESDDAIQGKNQQSEFQEPKPINIIKSKPLKSEKDKIANIKEKQANMPSMLSSQDKKEIKIHKSIKPYKPRVQQKNSKNQDKSESPRQGFQIFPEQIELTQPILSKGIITEPNNITSEDRPTPKPCKLGNKIASQIPIIKHFDLACASSQSENKQQQKINGASTSNVTASLAKAKKNALVKEDIQSNNSVNDSEDYFCMQNKISSLTIDINTKLDEILESSSKIDYKNGGERIRKKRDIKNNKDKDKLKKVKEKQLKPKKKDKTKKEIQVLNQSGEADELVEQPSAKHEINIEMQNLEIKSDSANLPPPDSSTILNHTSKDSIDETDPSHALSINDLQPSQPIPPEEGDRQVGQQTTATEQEHDYYRHMQQYQQMYHNYYMAHHAHMMERHANSHQQPETHQPCKACEQERLQYPSYAQFYMAGMAHPHGQVIMQGQNGMEDEGQFVIMRDNKQEDKPIKLSQQMMMPDQNSSPNNEDFYTIPVRNCSSPRRVYSPSPLNLNYTHSVSQLSAMSPNQKQFMRKSAAFLENEKRLLMSNEQYLTKEMSQASENCIQQQMVVNPFMQIHNLQDWTPEIHKIQANHSSSSNCSYESSYSSSEGSSSSGEEDEDEQSSYSHHSYSEQENGGDRYPKDIKPVILGNSRKSSVHINNQQSPHFGNISSSDNPVINQVQHQQSFDGARAQTTTQMNSGGCDEQMSFEQVEKGGESFSELNISQQTSQILEPNNISLTPRGQLFSGTMISARMLP